MARRPRARCAEASPPFKEAQRLRALLHATHQADAGCVPSPQRLNLRGRMTPTSAIRNGKLAMFSGAPLSASRTSQS